MLSEKRISITAKTLVNDAEIASYTALISAGKDDISFYVKQVDKAACKENRVLVRADQAEFEDFAYDLQEKMTGSM